MKAWILNTSQMRSSIKNLTSLPRMFSSGPPDNISKPDETGRNASPKYRPTELQKFILVWTKKFKTKADIPSFVSPVIIERSRSEARIKIANILMLLTALACVGVVISGKSAAKRGESVHQMNLDWHKKYNEEYEKNQNATK